MVNRIYVEKKSGFDHEARALKREINEFLGITALEGVRVINRYDVEGVDEALFAKCVENVFSEPQVDSVYAELPEHSCRAFITEYLPGQYDQRADSAAQCIQLFAQVERPTVRTATAYLLSGNLSDADEARIRAHVINPIEKRPSTFDKFDTLKVEYDIPKDTETLTGFTALDDEGIKKFVKEYSLAMDENDLALCRDYFASEHRDPTITEIRVLDTYWSDHCRHTTFLTHLTDVEISDPSAKQAFERYLSERNALGRSEKPVTLMDMATIGQKVLKAAGKLNDLDESDEINACTIRVKAVVDSEEQDWLVLFKNETHNHPTEIEPFGGAATCIGGAIRDPLSGRGYVYQAMRVTGAADPTKSASETISGKLPQRQIVTQAAAGYSAYGNQIGLATGLVEEIYHAGYAAKRMEIGAVVAAAPECNVVRKTPEAGDIVVLLGGRTGRDGCGGATGSSKKHTQKSLATCSAEVQKGNAPEERKLQRLFRNPNASRLIKRCNDFGAGGVSVAIGELSDGLKINLDLVPRKYEGLNATEIAISESQERMAVVLSAADLTEFTRYADEENIESTVVAEVTDDRRLTMLRNGKTVVSISRDFIDKNGAPKSATAKIGAPESVAEESKPLTAETLKALVGDLNACSRRGLCERFDSTNGAHSLLMPFGGKRQLTKTQVMAARISAENAESDTATCMSYGFDPYISEKNPYAGAYLAVVLSLAKLVACGSDLKNVHLSFQEYFKRMTEDSETWGQPLSALLGALDAQLDFDVAAIGGKDSMSGTFEDIHVPPTLVSFAMSVCEAANIRDNAFKRAGAPVVLICPEYKENGLPVAESQKRVFERVTEMLKSGAAVSASAIGRFGAAECAFNMALGNGFGFKSVNDAALTRYALGGFLVECAAETDIGTVVGYVTDEREFALENECVDMDELEGIYNSTLESVFPTEYVKNADSAPTIISDKRSKVYSGSEKFASARVLIPVFPGTNCEYDTERAFSHAGAEVKTFVIRNRSTSDVEASAKAFADEISRSQIIFIPGGFSGGDEPDGSGKFITAFFRNPRIRDCVHELLNTRDGLMGGICNGFQALVKLGLLPFGKILSSEECPATLTYNIIGRHQSRIVRTRVASKLSPWLNYAELGHVYSAPISHGEGRFIAPDSLIKQMLDGGAIATQYVDINSQPTVCAPDNPNGSTLAIEGITSFDGRVFGKMGHSERVGQSKPLYVNVPGDYDIGMFRAAVDYFK